MAISAVHYWLIRDLFEKGLLPQKGAILEIGEANMYGDVHSQIISDDIKKHVTDPERRDRLLRRLAELDESKDNFVLFEKAKLFYDIYYSPTEVQAVDFTGSPLAQKLDLNGPIKLNRKFDVAINHGTAEHVFNIGQVFRTMHDYTVAGGLMIHEGPFTGWIEHGFYNLQPTLFFDLADFNQYEIRGMVIEDFPTRTVLPLTSREDVYEFANARKIAENTSLFVVFRKSLFDRPFQVPVQGYYRGVLPQSGIKAWKDLR